MSDRSGLVLKKSEGSAFDLLGDRVSIMTAGRDTGGQYSLMHWVVAPNGKTVPHHHETIEEVFYLLEGRLRFILGDEEVEASAGDFVRVPPNTRHGFSNPDSSPVSAIVVFAPGGIEDLFVRYRTDGSLPFDMPRYLADAARDYGTHYEVPEGREPAV
jgi:mannose-6-phosphate isomerase-like protein (cupin superfamily)